MSENLESGVTQGIQLDWDLHSKQFPPTGHPGVLYERKDAITTVVDCLLFYDRDSTLAGILYHYNENNLWNPPGSFQIVVRADKRRQGIASALLRDAWHRWEITEAPQLFNEASHGFVEGLIRKGKIDYVNKTCANEEIDWNNALDWVPRWWDEVSE